MAKRVTDTLQSDFQDETPPAGAKERDTGEGWGLGPGREPTADELAALAAAVQEQQAALELEQMKQVEPPASFEQLIAEAEAKSDAAAQMIADAQNRALEAARMTEAARAAWDALFVALKALRQQDRPGYSGSNLARLLNYIPSVER